MATDVNKAGTGDEEALRAFMNGAFADRLGLGPDDIQVGLDVAQGLMRRGAFAQALRFYAAMVMCRPSDVDLQIGLSNCALQLGENHLALQAASVAVALAPSGARGYYLSARACLGLGFIDEAREDLRDAVRFGQQARDGVVVEEARRLSEALPAPAETPAAPQPAVA